LEDSQLGGCRLDPYKIEARTFPAGFCTWGGAGLSRYAATKLIFALFPGHSHRTRFRPWSPIVTGNHLDRAEKIPNFAQKTGTVEVFVPLSGVSVPLCGELSHFQIFMNDRPNPLA